MRRASLFLVPPVMYRHFAAMTLALTFALAMFAEGERHQARAVDIPQSQPTPEPRPARFAIATDAPIRNPVPTNWYSESGFDGAFGQPMHHLLDSVSSSAAIREEEAPAEIEEQADENGSLTAADRKELLRQLRNSRAAAAPPSDAP